MATPAIAFGVHPNNWGDLAFRLILAALVGGAIGWNRETSGKAAGLRTHMMVSLGSALFVIVPLLVNSSPSEEAVSRAIQGIATGIGFIGAGEIVQQVRESGKPIIKGLTSAASTWVTAALGIVAACGFWQVSLIGTAIALVILIGGKRLEHLADRREE
ncbi:MAG: MgtC/SapB family protein [Leptolyngbyaceae cyanobacterium RU_5_1]|nr:MgtC/SapB family protein [Leptolyngbyaceae cyanobacterium RU_5_1]